MMRRGEIVKEKDKYKLKNGNGIECMGASEVKTEKG